jgi:hypothetical protein
MFFKHVSHNNDIVTMQSVPITTNVEFEALSWRDVFDTTLCDKVRHLLATGRWFSTVLRFPPPIRLIYIYILRI